MKLTKRHSIFILLAMLFSLSAFAQTSFDKTAFLKAHSDYFYAAQMENSQLALYAYADKYTQLSEDDKKPLIHSAIQQSGLTSVLVYCKYNRELWMHRSDGAIETSFLPAHALCRFLRKVLSALVCTLICLLNRCLHFFRYAWQGLRLKSPSQTSRQ